MLDRIEVQLLHATKLSMKKEGSGKGKKKDCLVSALFQCSMTTMTMTILHHYNGGRLHFPCLGG